MIMRNVYQIFLVAAVCATVASVVASDHGALFEGGYSINNVNESSDSVSLQLAVTVTNTSGGEIHYGTVRILCDTAAEDGETCAEFQEISLPLGGSARLSRGLSVTSDVYEEWAAGSLFAEIDGRDENGAVKKALVELQNRTTD